EPPAADQLARQAETAVELRALLAAGLKDLIRRPGDAHQGSTLIDGKRQRLLAVDVLAGAHGGQGGERGPVVRRADGDGVDIAPGQQFAEVLVLLAGRADDVGSETAVVPIHVADGDELHAWLAHGGTHDVNAALAVDPPVPRAARIVGADADGAHGDAV